MFQLPFRGSILKVHKDHTVEEKAGGAIEEGIAFSKQHGYLQITEIEIHVAIFNFIKRMNRIMKADDKKKLAQSEKDHVAIFNFIKRMNRIMKADDKKKLAQSEKDHTAAVEAIKLTHPSTTVPTSLCYPHSYAKIGDHLSSLIQILSQNMDLGKSEKVE
ncbi:hypothetical protein QE152_g36712 [Popillia japonica]|uniref:Uncharacterized protein n=1 Tax=Popillia japonica TaxID=7064 RepID=A0AAW1ICI9_POPJA